MENFTVFKGLHACTHFHKVHGGNSQNFLSIIVRFFVTLGLKILRFLRLKVVFEADIIKR